jgi:DUF4097 and DUF4098 domain-containing protein YvlB
VGIPVALALIANSAFSLLAPFAEGRYHVSYTAPARIKSLAMGSSGGTISVKPTTGDRVTLAGTARYSFIRSTFSAQTNEGDTVMNYHCAPLPSSNCGLDATVSVPVTMPVNVHTDGGNISVANISAPVTLHSDGGDLSADHVTGLLNLSTNGGNIRLNDIPVQAGKLTASTRGGDVDADGISSPTVTVHTDGGNIRAAGVMSPEVNASTDGGDIEIVFTSVPDNVQVQTSGGNITLVLPADSTQYNVSPQTTGGNVSVSNDLRNTTSKHVITATTRGGDITITRQQ